MNQKLIVTPVKEAEICTFTTTKYYNYTCWLVILRVMLLTGYQMFLGNCECSPATVRHDHLPPNIYLPLYTIHRLPFTVYPSQIGRAHV